MKLREDKARLRRKYLDLARAAREINGIPSCISDTIPDHENHHIIPVSWGGSDSCHNLVRFTLRQHYIAHSLLSALMETDHPMIAVNSRHYEIMRIAVRANEIERANTPEAKKLAAMWSKMGNHKNRPKPSKSSNALRSNTLKNKPNKVCPHCGRAGRGGFLRFHFDHCKDKV